MTATDPAPDLIQSPAPPAPRFPVGMLVKVDGLFGLQAADDDRYEARHRIVGIRLRPEMGDEWVGTEDEGRYMDVIGYPHGWEFEVASRRTGRAWGWVTEAELIEKGYAPSR